MVGIILLTITIFVHKNTYSCDLDGEIVGKVPSPRFLYIVFIIFSTIPVVNVIAFIMGVIMYTLIITDDDITFHCEYRWWKALVRWLLKEI